MRISILEQFKNLEKTLTEKFSPFGIIPSFLFSPTPINEILSEASDAAILPLQECPINLPLGLVITALSEREAASFSILLKKEKQQEDSILGIPSDATIAVSSLVLKRRLVDFFPNATIEVEKNILDKWESEAFDVIVLPTFYLTFIYNKDYIIHELHHSEFVPRAGQGCFAYITRADDLTTRRNLKKIHHSEAVRFTNIERSMQRKWENAAQEGVAFCEKDAQNCYHLYTQIIDENGAILSEKSSSSTISTWATI